MNGGPASTIVLSVLVRIPQLLRPQIGRGPEARCGALRQLPTRGCQCSESRVASNWLCVKIDSPTCQNGLPVPSRLPDQRCGSQCNVTAGGDCGYRPVLNARGPVNKRV